jgi:hypothetical protein
MKVARRFIAGSGSLGCVPEGPCGKDRLASYLSRDPFNRPARRGYFPHPPGTSCLAIIMLSLWGEIHSPRRGFD